MIKIQFLGGVADGDDLTGSSSLLTVQEGKRTSKILIDAGLRQGGKDSLPKNREILKYLKPAEIDFVVLTHPHIDHVGLLPMLTRYGFKGRIICTEETAELLPVMLEDSAKIQMAEAKSRSRKKNLEHQHLGADHLSLGNYDRKRNQLKNHKENFSPLYSLDNVTKTIGLVKNGGFNYDFWLKLTKDVDLKFYPSGHVLGGAICVFRVNSKIRPKYLGFSGDLGREDGIILPPPGLIKEPLDSWVVESTYGDRLHPPRDKELTKLLNIAKTAAVKKQKVIVPSFALERAQEIIYLLVYHMKIGDIPKIPIYLDSPMSVKITEIFAANWETGLFNDQGKLDINPFSGKNDYLRTINDRATSEALASEPGPYIVVAAAGNCDAGPVRKHLEKELSNPYSTVCIVGYMPERSLGRQLKDGLPIVHMNGEEIMVKARIISFESFSAHADSRFLTKYTSSVAALSDNIQIFINHGEERSAIILKSELLKILENKIGNKKILVPQRWQEFSLS